MKTTRLAGLRVAVLLALQVLWAGASVAQTSGTAISSDEVAKQQSIYQSKGDDTPKGYVVGRSLSSYLYVLPAGFDRSLASLSAKDRWLDIGAGEGNAILDYCTSKYDGTLLKGEARPGKKAKAIAMSIEDRRTAKWHQTAASLEADQIRYVFGKPLRQYSVDELGKFQVITDVLGGFSYASDLSLFMEKTLGFLDVNGSFYTVLQDVRNEEGNNKPHYPDASFLTELTKQDGSELKMCSWLKSIGCVEVTCEAKSGWTPPIEVYHVRKVCDNVTVPALTPTQYTAGTPPERKFRLKNPAGTETVQAK